CFGCPADGRSAGLHGASLEKQLLGHCRPRLLHAGDGRGGRVCLVARHLEPAGLALLVFFYVGRRNLVGAILPGGPLWLARGPATTTVVRNVTEQTTRLHGCRCEMLLVLCIWGEKPE